MSTNFSKFDVFYRSLVLSKFYTKGWGKPDHIKELLRLHKIVRNRDECFKLVSPQHKINIEKETKHKDYTIIKGNFVSPVNELSPGILPDEVKIAQFEMITPNKLNDVKPACIHMAGTGDHGFNRRREYIAKPLLKNGITSVLLENPFYGGRKPKKQWRSCLLHVNDLFIMGCCLILESIVLLHWLKRLNYGPLGVTGVSMGGHMASLAASGWPEKLAVVPCMSWTSASVVWIDGVMSRSLPWRLLEKQYSENEAFEKEIFSQLKKLTSPIDVNSFNKKSPSWFIKNNTQLVQQESEKRRLETVVFMKMLMDEFTHLGNYSVPVCDGKFATFVIASQDAYYPQHKLTPMDEVWPNCEVRKIETGHVLGFLIYQRTFIKAIVDTFNRLLVSLDKKTLDEVAHANFETTVQENKHYNKSTSWTSALTNLHKKIVTKL